MAWQASNQPKEAKMNLPDDVMLDICARLPVKSVRRFRCVNKSWYKLLNGRRFVQQHLHHAAEMDKLKFCDKFYERLAASNLHHTL